MPPLPPITQDGALTCRFGDGGSTIVVPAPGIHVSAHAAKNENVYSVGRRPAERGAAASAAETRTPLRIAFGLASRVILESVFNRACNPTSKCLYSDELPFLFGRR